MLALSPAILATSLASLALTASAGHALAPRASPSPGDSFYRPPYQCATSITQFVGSPLPLASADYRTDTNSLNCEYGDEMDSCSYDTATGALAVPGLAGCPATLSATGGCVYECALKETGGTDLLEVLYLAYDNTLQCEYWTGNQWLFCLYSSSGTLSANSGASSGHSCPTTVSYQCAVGQSPRRSYRGVDNYTAWLDRRAARRAREAAPAAAPAPVAAPVARRKYYANRRG
ncbi:hypothetical protein L226DRAFT_617799 [Lentinus tigrinus ALCF2SS1-7]|uniref:Ig-like domain-containing protein n=1 Tax=Lentinus tigrinus ALCF2SS1-6 TaxID=1328759 RepID=A0A5C2SMN5_9APHY|nr:hypothetical protein L227DRAFT_598756 [Lentinus tigrinus ALCF2SS1-6]RPD67946.1 hypothetical protein L226DRAFT_617799 [Lentinus tigrinus ALCF2SS1-7]